MNIIIKKMDIYINAEDIFDLFKGDYRSSFLDSSMQNDLGRYSIIGINPYKIIEGNKKDSLKEIKLILEKYKHVNTTELPIISGGIGYIAYDEGEKNKRPELSFVFYDNFIIEDTLKKEVYIIANSILEDGNKTIEKIIDKITKEVNEKYQIGKSKGFESIESVFTEEEYKSRITSIKSDIENGDVYILNFTNKIYVKSKENPYSVFKALQKSNKAPFAAYINADGFEIISSSPEEFIRIKDGIIRTRPIKGTRKKTGNPEVDKTLKNELLNSEKDKSELLMVIDLERNDFNKICIPKSVKVEKLFSIEEYATLYHLVSDVYGKLKEEIDITDVLNEIFPGGSITGAPKISAMNHILKYEKEKRGLYTGSIGYISFSGESVFNIIIRTAIHSKGVYEIGTGGGITYESEEDFEYREMILKSLALLNVFENKNTIEIDDALSFGLGLFETINIVDGRAVFLNEHLKRINNASKILSIENKIDDFTVNKYILNNHIKNGALKIILTEKNLCFQLRENVYSYEKYLKGFNIKFSNIIRNETSVFTYIKSLNYGDNILEKRRAIKEGIDEVIFLNTKGEITEGSTTNIFFVKNNKIYTPCTNSGLLNGIMRDYIIKNYEVVEKIIYPKELACFEEVFLTNSLMGVMRVNSIEGNIYNKHNLTDEIYKKLKS